MLARGQSLTELAGIGPYLNKQIIDWLRHPPESADAIPEIRQNFLTLAEARTLRSKYPERFLVLTFIVKLMGALVILFRTQERGGHREQASSSEDVPCL